MMMKSASDEDLKFNEGTGGVHKRLQAAAAKRQSGTNLGSGVQVTEDNPFL